MLREPEYIPPSSKSIVDGATSVSTVVSSVYQTTSTIASSIWAKWRGRPEEKRIGSGSNEDARSHGHDRIPMSVAPHLRWRPPVLWTRLQQTETPGLAVAEIVYKYGGVHLWVVKDDHTVSRFAFAKRKASRHSLLPAANGTAAFMPVDPDIIPEDDADTTDSDGLSMSELLCLSAVDGYGTPQIAHVITNPCETLSLDAYVQSVMHVRAEKRRHHRDSRPAGDPVAALRADKPRTLSEESVKSSHSSTVDEAAGAHTFKDKVVDQYADFRPLIAVAVRAEESGHKRNFSASERGQAKEVLIYSLRDHKYIHSLRFRSPVCGMHSNGLVLLVVCLDVMYGFSTHSLELMFRMPVAPHAYGDGFATIALSNMHASGEDPRQDFLVFVPHQSVVPSLQLQEASSAVSLNDGTDAPATVVIGRSARTSSTVASHKEGGASLEAPASRVEARDVLRGTVSTVYSLRDTLIQKVVGAPRTPTAEQHVPTSHVALVNLLQLAGDFALWKMSVESMSGETPEVSGKSKRSNSKSTLPFVPRARLQGIRGSHPAFIALDMAADKLAVTDIYGQFAQVFRLDRNTHRGRFSDVSKCAAPTLKERFLCERGVTVARCTRLSFSVGGKWLALTSEHGTVHMFPLVDGVVGDANPGVQRIYAHAKIRQDVDSAFTDVDLVSPVANNPASSATTGATATSSSTTTTTTAAPPQAFRGYGAMVLDTLADMHAHNLVKVGTIDNPEQVLPRTLLVSCDGMLVGDYCVGATRAGRINAHSLAVKLSVTSIATETSETSSEKTVATGSPPIVPASDPGVELQAHPLEEAAVSSKSTSSSGSDGSIPAAEQGSLVGQLFGRVAQLAGDTLGYFKGPVDAAHVHVSVDVTDLGSWDVRRQSHWPDVCAPSALPQSVPTTSVLAHLSRMTEIDSEMLHMRDLEMEMRQVPAAAPPPLNKPLDEHIRVSPSPVKEELFTPPPEATLITSEPAETSEPDRAAMVELPFAAASLTSPPAAATTAVALTGGVGTFGGTAPVQEQTSHPEMDSVLEFSRILSGEIPIPRTHHEEPNATDGIYLNAFASVQDMELHSVLPSTQELSSSSLLAGGYPAASAPMFPPVPLLTAQADQLMDRLHAKQRLSALAIQLKEGVEHGVAADGDVEDMDTAVSTEKNSSGKDDLADFDNADDAASKELTTILDTCRETGEVPPEEVLNEMFASQQFEQPAPATAAASVRLHHSTATEKSSLSRSGRSSSKRKGKGR